jgi:2-phosphoglycerate kinase
MNNSQKIFIYGVPGTGKTKYSKILGRQTGFSIVEADQIKKKLGIHIGTCQAFKQFGDFNRENVIKGLIFVRKALCSTVLKEVTKRDAIILEGAFLNPQQLLPLGRVLLLTTTDEYEHKKQFRHHLEYLFDIHETTFKAARIIQEYFCDEAKKLRVETIDSSELE